MSKSQLNLPRIVLLDLWHHKWVMVVALLVMLNAIAVVYTSYEGRQYISQWELLLQERDRLDIEWRNLLLEEQSRSEHSRVTRMATKELNMRRPLPKEEVVVRVR
ncbi:cell division protein FtsL [Shewanella sp. Choline-02u-19]|uniref:cell division protein FtsL n=1 Tax=Shewanella TaxID=22 RepID=UPI000C323386|nr:MULTISPECIES: cell division protein FtsL [unclassified Shewanella]MCL1059773.1 cell division protein FtsL [Shewanella gelidimarina]PKG56790.1 cell division protein FtsL [Shewanella sp. GutDb-MelDb]PKG75690.1 cell division protein FtsL [Shewanella sp. GutCb]PKH60591.1 cell division protein FtsL [Shewanella sp. Bg11-22]PKI30413.1 cell division protein FtsL [Shewanella sp. Choline-02u-19]